MKVIIFSFDRPVKHSRGTGTIHVKTDRADRNFSHQTRQCKTLLHQSTARPCSLWSNQLLRKKKFHIVEIFQLGITLIHYTTALSSFLFCFFYTSTLWHRLNLQTNLPTWYQTLEVSLPTTRCSGAVACTEGQHGVSLGPFGAIKEANGHQRPSILDKQIFPSVMLHNITNVSNNFWDAWATALLQQIKNHLWLLCVWHKGSSKAPDRQGRKWLKVSHLSKLEMCKLQLHQPENDHIINACRF